MESFVKINFIRQVYSFILIKTSTMAHGKEIRLQALASFIITKVLSTKDNGKAMSSTVLANNIGLMEHIFEVILPRETKNQGNSNGQIKVHITVNSKIINFKEKENLFGKIRDATKELGKIISCMDSEFLHGQMVKYLKDIMKIRKNAAQES